MALFNLVAQKSEVDEILRDLLLLGYVQFRSAFEDIDESNFTLSVMEENAEELIDMVEISRFEKNSELRETVDKINYIMETIKYKPVLQENEMRGDYSFSEIKASIDRIHEHFKELMDETAMLREKLERIEKFTCEACFDGINIDFKRLVELNNFVVKWGFLTAQNRQKVIRNYENISAAVMHIGSKNDQEVYMVICPKELEREAERILRSVEFEAIEPAVEYFDYPESMNKKILQAKHLTKSRLKDLMDVARDYIEHYREELNRCYSRLIMEQEMERVKELIAVTKNFTYLSAWVPQGNRKDIESYLEDESDELILTFRDVGAISQTITIPTSLKNGFIFRPFEELVTMYGIPSYDELDPTVFLGISYLLLFGAMFGDLGQGLVLLLAGLFISNRINENYGGILSRLGVSSMVFGLVYDSFFGYEHLISKVIPGNFYFRPIDNIDTVLMVSIFVGIVLLLMSFLFSIVNKLSRKELREGLFGRNGIAGLALFLSILTLVVERLLNLELLPDPLLYFLSVTGVILIIVREPLTNLMTHQRPLYHEKVSEYYVESGFDIFETFLSMLSNSVSFIRVGAFALNHVGLFIAFHTMAHIIGSLAGNIAMFLIGNLIVIFLEGLIVFIQGLRLVYYEMFSKYYKGEGILFTPVTIIKEEI
jgi:V/A-type H+-transporting ATPase subunit I